MIAKRHFMQRIGERKGESNEERKAYTLSHLLFLVKECNYKVKTEPLIIKSGSKSWFLTGTTVFKFDGSFCWLENQQYEFYGNIKEIKGNKLEFY